MEEDLDPALQPVYRKVRLTAALASIAPFTIYGKIFILSVVWPGSQWPMYRSAAQWLGTSALKDLCQFK